ncbi:hypothetical protein ABIA39_008570 [Nocardia sp. GAS34]
MTLDPPIVQVVRGEAGIQKCFAVDGVIHDPLDAGRLLTVT